MAIAAESLARWAADGADAVGILQRLRDFSAAARLNRTMSGALEAAEPSRLAASPVYYERLLPAGSSPNLDMRTFEQLTAGTSLHPKVRRMHEYWLTKRADRLMPARADIDPLELRDCLGNLCIVDVTGEMPPRFRFRLDGSNLVLSTGFDMTGKFLEEMPDADYRRFVTAIYQRVVETRTPVFVVNQEDWKGYDLQVESVTMPLSGDGARVDGILDAIFTVVQR